MTNAAEESRDVLTPMDMASVGLATMARRPAKQPALTGFRDKIADPDLGNRQAGQQKLQPQTNGRV